jgi:hypothetical protein
MTTNQSSTTATAPKTAAKCNKYHSGNKTLVKMGRGRLAGFRECSGCGQLYTLAQLAKM